MVRSRPLERAFEDTEISAYARELTWNLFVAPPSRELCNAAMAVKSHVYDSHGAKYTMASPTTFLRTSFYSFFRSNRRRSLLKVPDSYRLRRMLYVTIYEHTCFASVITAGVIDTSCRSPLRIYIYKAHRCFFSDHNT